MPSTLPQTTFTLPPLQGPNLDHHFWSIGNSVSEPYLSLSKEFSDCVLPTMPDSWVVDTPGWTKYYLDGSSHSVDEGPSDESMIVFDVETLPHISQHAVMAVAASQYHWYSWISPYLTKHSDSNNHFIPLGQSNSRPRIIVGHNVGFDRARLQSEYNLRRSTNRFIDTMSLHVAVRGISSPQRPVWLAHQKEKQLERDYAIEASASVRHLLEKYDDPELRNALMKYEADEKAAQEAVEQSLTQISNDDLSEHQWQDIASSNSLNNVYELYCPNDPPLDKETRDIFMNPESNNESLQPHLNDLMNYCALDVQATHDVYTRVLPLFLERCPHPVSFAGMLGMGNSFLPIDESWNEYIRNSESKYKELSSNVQDSLGKLAEEARNKMNDESWKDDVWLSQLDWTPKKTRGQRKSNKTTKTEFKVEEGGDSNHIPKWLGKIMTRKLDNILSSAVLKSRIIPLLIEMKFLGYPLIYTKTLGWAACVPKLEANENHHHLSLSLNDDDNIVNKDDYLFVKLAKTETGIKTSTYPTHNPLSSLNKSLVEDEKLTSKLNKGDLLNLISGGDDQIETLLLKIILECYVTDGKSISEVFRNQLDWNTVKNSEKINQRLIKSLDQTDHQIKIPNLASTKSKKKKISIKDDDDFSSKSNNLLDDSYEYMPKWYWDIDGKKKRENGQIEVTVRSKLSPLLLKLRWLNYPVFHSRKHGWIYRVPRLDILSQSFKTRQSPLSFKHPSDQHLHQMSYREDAYDNDNGDYIFYKIPHKDGEEHNVGNLLSKGFIHALDNGILTSSDNAAHAAMDLNAQCSYWISARERVSRQFAVFEKKENDIDMGFNDSKRGLILPEVITMGTITRRAIEKTWLTASNAKKNRVGSELKAMVKAPSGYSFVGADVDSEELWICSALGDAQFGVQGATSIGWMTLEGTKSAGTDLHSVSAKILGITRDQAKVGFS